MASDDDVTAAPAIVMVASGMMPASLVLPPSVDLGRTVTANGATHEITDERVSREHATVRWDRGMWSIRDLDSRNGTFVQGERIQGEVKRRGDVVLRIGHTVFVLVADGRGQPARTHGDLVIGPELARAHAQIEILARQSSLLVVQGGAGVGKQLAARLYHGASSRAAGPFHVVACGGIQGVADRLVFGGKKGVIETIGHLQMARGGTLYLANLHELDPMAQASLVKLVAQYTAGTTPIEANVACSCPDLRLAAADGQLRGDLAEALAPYAVTIPPLRARRVDLARLAQLEADELGRARGVELQLHPRFVEACAIRPWPGNVRELRAAVRHAAAHALSELREVVRAEDLLDNAGLPPGETSAETSVERKSGGPIDLGPEALATAMQRANGSLAAAARTLNLHRTQLAKLLDDAAIPYEGLAHDD